MCCDVPPRFDCVSINGEIRTEPQLLEQLGPQLAYIARFDLGIESRDHVRTDPVRQRMAVDGVIVKVCEPRRNDDLFQRPFHIVQIGDIDVLAFVT